MKRNSAYSGTFPLCQLAEYPLFSFLCSAYTNFDMTTVHIENDRGETIVGLFEHRDIDANREKPRLVLIGHGVQGNAAHVNRDVCGENDLSSSSPSLSLSKVTRTICFNACLEKNFLIQVSVSTFVATVIVQALLDMATLR